MILYVILAGCFLKEKVQTPEINACFSYINNKGFPLVILATFLCQPGCEF